MPPTRFNRAYIGPRNDILELIPATSTKILDVGCSTGLLGDQIKAKIDAEVFGIEIDQAMAKLAEKPLDGVIFGDIEGLDLAQHFNPDYFDCIILADILEHLKDPWRVLKLLTNILRTEGSIIASIPNIRHYTTLINLIFKGYWPYRDRGIHDRNHLRFFTLRNIKSLFKNSDLAINDIKRNYRIIERPHPYNRFARFIAFPILREFLSFQYLVIAEKTGSVCDQ